MHPVTAIASMTGFARAEGQEAGSAWTIEIKSVNGRNLDLRCRFPAGFDGLETATRTEVARRVKRGNITVMLTVSRPGGASPVRINRDLIARLVELAGTIEGLDPAPLRLDALLAVRGVVESSDESEVRPSETLEPVLLAGLGTAMDGLQRARLAEGARLAVNLDRLLAEIDGLIGAASRCAAAQPGALKERLRAQVSALLEAVPALPEERLAQEAALLIARGDIREELERLQAHQAAARDLLAEGAAIGRRFDFLCQEFNREANTLCSKSSDTELTRIGLALKAAIEQLREQVQNIE